MPSSKNQHITINNLDPINKAIDVEVSKRNELSSLYSSQKNINKSTVLLNICIALCLLLLTIGALYWFFYSKNINTPMLSPQDKSTAVSLNKISKSDDSINKSIDKSFTVFQRVLIDTGEYVVTGKNFIPEDLTKPTDQYCYIEPLTAESGMAGEPIASMNANELIMETENKYLLQFAFPACQFSK